MAHASRAATEAIFDLAEGVIWDDRAGLVRWVDIWKGRVHSGRLDDGRIVDIATIELGAGQTAGAVALADDGGLLVAAARGLATVSPEGVVAMGPDLLGDRDSVRMNDASVDPQGRFVLGTLAYGEHGDAFVEVLLRVSADGAVETLRTGVGLSNGIGFSPDGATIYHVDTLAGTLSSHTYGPGPFDLSEPWNTVVTGLPHYPDGITVSAEGDLWIAQWGGSSVRRHAATGELLDTVTVDATQASCPGFVGPGRDILAITTAQQDLGSWTDQSGAIFLADVDATGIAEPRWPGSTTTPYWLDTADFSAPPTPDTKAGQQ